MFYYFSFKEYQKLDKNIKDQFKFLSTSFSTPLYWDGESFDPFVPSKELFYDACKNFKESNFEERYKKQIYSLNKTKILKQLKRISDDKDIVFLVWEDENKESERDIFIPWLTNTTINERKYFSFSLKEKSIKIQQLNIFNL